MHNVQQRVTWDRYPVGPTMLAFAFNLDVDTQTFLNP